MNGDDIEIETIQAVNVKRDAWIRGFIDRVIIDEPWLLYRPSLCYFCLFGGRNISKGV